MAGVNPHLETLEPWISAGVRHVVSMAELNDVFPADFQRVDQAVHAAGGKLLGPAYARYYGMPTETLDVEIGFGIDKPMDVPGLTVAEQPATRAVVGTHVGSYDQLPESYDELMTWLQGQDLELADSMWEFYDSPPDTDPAQTVTRIVFPLREQG